MCSINAYWDWSERWLQFYCIDIRSIFQVLLLATYQCLVNGKDCVNNCLLFVSKSSVSRISQSAIVVCYLFYRPIHWAFVRKRYISGKDLQFSGDNNFLFVNFLMPFMNSNFNENWLIKSLNPRYPKDPPLCSRVKSINSPLTFCFNFPSFLHQRKKFKNTRIFTKNSLVCLQTALLSTFC